MAAKGANFNPYLGVLTRQVYVVRMALMPQRERPPEVARATTIIRFAIDRRGYLRAVHLEESTHDDEFNRVAWEAITSVGCFGPLPSEFRGPELALRIHFHFNQSRKLDDRNASAGHAVASWRGQQMPTMCV